MKRMEKRPPQRSNTASKKDAFGATLFASAPARLGGNGSGGGTGGGSSSSSSCSGVSSQPKQK